MENEELHENYFLTNLVVRERTLDLGQILQRILSVRNNTWARFVIDTSSIIEVEWVFTWSINGSLIFTRFVRLSHYICPKVYFPSYLETKISAASEAYI